VQGELMVERLMRSVGWPVVGIWALLGTLLGSACGQEPYWREIAVAPSSSSFSSFIAPLCYDPYRDRFVSTGGLEIGPAGSFGFAGDTRIFDANTGAWSIVSATASPNPARHGPVLDFDLLRGCSVFYGGGDYSSSALNDTWEFDGTSWQQVVTANSPGPRIFAAMSYDYLHGGMVLFGGDQGFTGGPANNDTWFYDGNDWTLLSTNGPPARAYHALVFDSARNVHVLFGGRVPTGGQFADTWEFSVCTGVWTQVTTAQAPSPRYLHAMAFDFNRQEIVLHGGRLEGLGIVHFGDTWSFDGVDWTPLIPATAGPGWRDGAGCTSSLASGEVVLSGGSAGPTPGTGYPAEVWALGQTTPSQFPGNGSDAVIDVFVDGSFAPGQFGVHQLSGGQNLSLRLSSRTGALNQAPLALFYSLATPPLPSTGLALGPGAPEIVWLDLNNLNVVLDGLANPASATAPRLAPGGVNIGPLLVDPALAGSAAVVQMVALNPASTAFGYDFSDALGLVFN
jgi:galactose oxidase-like protein